MTETLAACMIVRDAAATIKRSINSVRRYVDELCIFDTGSVDGTLELLDELARRPGSPIRVERGAWRDDFSWAREQSFAMASSAHLLWIDDDEILIGGEHVRRYAASCDALYIRRLDEPFEGDIWRLWHTRVVRRSAQPRWVGRVHEFLEVTELSRRAVASPLEVRFVERRFAHPPNPVRHQYDELVRAEYSDTQHPRLVVYIANQLLNEHRVEEALRLLEGFVGSFEDEESRMSAYYIIASFRLCELLWSVGRLRDARVVWRARALAVASWTHASQAGALRGERALRHVFDAYDELDTPGGERGIQWQS